MDTTTETTETTERRDLQAEWAEVEELAADIAEDLGLLHTHPVAVLTMLHDRARGQR